VVGGESMDTLSCMRYYGGGELRRLWWDSAEGADGWHEQFVGVDVRAEVRGGEDYAGRVGGGA